jgi:predicted amidohydrolase
MMVSFIDIPGWTRAARDIDNAGSRINCFGELMADTLRIATVQSRIERDIATNGAHIRDLLDNAAAQGATLALFPEGALSGYSKAQVRDWAAFDWATLERELASIADHALQLGLTAVIGSADAVAGRRPHNSLFVLPAGSRYDKRHLSHSEITGWYTPGFAPVTFEQSGFALGMTVCIEMQFPELFAGYERLGVDCVLHATYGLGPLGDVILRAHAATNCLWLAVATPANADEPPGGIIGPDGNWMARCGPGVDIAVAELDRADPRFDIALNKARPWRRVAREGRIYRDAV